MATVIRNNVPVRNEINGIGEVNKMPPHIQQMLFEFALERGYIDMIIKMKEEENAK